LLREAFLTQIQSFKWGVIAVKVWVYVSDMFYEVVMSPDDVRRLLVENPLKLFKAVENFLPDYIRKSMLCVMLYSVYYNPRTKELVVHYLIDFENGRDALRVICSDNPVQTLYDYNEYEKLMSDIVLGTHRRPMLFLETLKLWCKPKTVDTGTEEEG